ncbi:MAG: NlpC/P60 family protein [Thermodesulfobacteriota bacterium]
MAVLLLFFSAALTGGCYKQRAEAGPPLSPTITSPPVVVGDALDYIGGRLSDRLLPQAKVQRLLAVAYSKTGLPYRRGGTSPETGFDCAGFTQWVFTQNGLPLPRTPQDQFGSGRPISKEELRPGDLVFYDEGYLHVGIYAGDGLFIHSPHTGDRIKESRAFDRYHKKHWAGARRVIQDTEAAPLDENLKEVIIRQALAEQGLDQAEEKEKPRQTAGKPAVKKAAAKSTEKPAVKKAVAKSEAKGKKTKVYVVQSGDTIWKVARRLGISHKALLKANGLKENHTLRIGQKLTVPQS